MRLQWRTSRRSQAFLSLASRQLGTACCILLTVRSASGQNVSGYKRFAGTDLHSGFENLVPVLVATSNVNQSLLCGGKQGLLYSPSDCGTQCSVFAACTGFTHDATLKENPGCCFLKNSTTFNLEASPNYDTYIQDSYASSVVLPLTGGATTPQGSQNAPSSGGGGLSAGLIAGIIVAIVVIVLLAVCTIVFFCCKRRKRRKRQEPPLTVTDSLVQSQERKRSFGRNAAPAAADGEVQEYTALGESCRFFTPAEMDYATGGFAAQSLLGEGKFGQVYLAVLPDGTRLTVRKLTEGLKRVSERVFLRELEALSCVLHPNLLPLRGYCIAKPDCFLVQDYAENGSLDLAIRRAKKPLSWDDRVEIAVGAARGLAHLHRDCDPPIVHRDVKSANIVLSAKVHAQVADFGLAKLVEGERIYRNPALRGTQGYMAPELEDGGRASFKSDVYSFGVVLLELASGRPALEVARDGAKRRLADLAFRNQHQLHVLMDPRLEQRYPPDEATRLLTIALSCVAQKEIARPGMLEVLRGLEKMSKGPPKAPASPPGKSPESWIHADGPQDSDSVSGQSNISQSEWSQPTALSDNQVDSISMAYPSMSIIREGR